MLSSQAEAMQASIKHRGWINYAEIAVSLVGFGLCCRLGSGSLAKNESLHFSGICSG